MPIKRGGDGELYEEPTKPVGARRERDEPKSDSEALTRPTRTRAVDPEDSLFGPDTRTSGDASWDEPTKPLRRRSGDETRILTRAKSGEADHPAARRGDPMADPPVGWLVIVRGPGKGHVLTLGNGMNAIGRGENSRVRVDFGDDGVSRDNHARLVYEPRQRCFLLSHGEGANLTYLNGEVVLQSQPIESGAEIQIGDTTMRFQSFCSQAFDWPDVDD